MAGFQSWENFANAYSPDQFGNALSDYNNYLSTATPGWQFSPNDANDFTKGFAYWRKAPNQLGPQPGMVSGTEQGFERISPEFFNGGDFDLSKLEQGVTGTSTTQNKANPILRYGVPLALGAIAAGGAATGLGYGPWAAGAGTAGTGTAAELGQLAGMGLEGPGGIFSGTGAPVAAGGVGMSGGSAVEAGGLAGLGTTLPGGIFSGGGAALSDLPIQQMPPIEITGQRPQITNPTEPVSPDLRGGGFPGAPSGLPGGILPQQPGQQTGTRQTDPFSALQWIYDAWAKRRTGDEQRELADKIFGRSADFENMLMGTYRDPSAWLQGPEGQALNRITQNQSLRTDSRAGNLSNDMNRSAVLQDRMMQGLGNYRQGLSRDAMIGRGASAVAMQGMNQGLGNQLGMFSPIAYGAANNGQSIPGTIKDIWSTVTTIGGDVGNWINEIFEG